MWNTQNYNLFSALCYSVNNQKCLMNNTLTKNSDLKGCFWNPQYEQFTCVVFDDDFEFETSVCKESCQKVCSENYWKCNELCIPIIQPCDGECMKYFTYNCNGGCVPVNKPCNSKCHLPNQIYCNGQCLFTKSEKELIVKSGCEGKRWS